MNNQKQKQQQQNIWLVIVLNGLDVVFRIDDEIYVLSITKRWCSYFESP